MMEFKSSIGGIDKLMMTFQRLPRASQRKAYYPSLRSGGEVVRMAATENIKAVSEPYSGMARRPNTLRVYNLKKFRGHFRVAVQVRRGLVNPAKRDKEGNPVRVGLYLAVLEYGSQKLNRRPRPWLRKALREQQTKAVESIRISFSSKMNEILSDARGRG